MQSQPSLGWTRSTELSLGPHNGVSAQSTSKLWSLGPLNGFQVNPNGDSAQSRLDQIHSLESSSAKLSLSLVQAYRMEYRSTRQESRFTQCSLGLVQAELLIFKGIQVHPMQSQFSLVLPNGVLDHPMESQPNLNLPYGVQVHSMESRSTQQSISLSQARLGPLSGV